MVKQVKMYCRPFNFHNSKFNRKASCC